MPDDLNPIEGFSHGYDIKAAIEDAFERAVGIDELEVVTIRFSRGRGVVGPATRVLLKPTSPAT